MTFKIALLGFQEYEEKLFSQQLKTVRKHTDSDWLYQQDSQTSDYIIEHGKIANKAFIYKANEKSIQHEIDWPVRLFGLLEVLKSYEKNSTTVDKKINSVSTKTKTANTLNENLAHLESNFYFKLNNIYVFIDKENDQVFTNLKSFNELLDALSSVDSLQSLISYSYSPDAEFADTKLVYTGTLKNLIWSRFLSCKETLKQDWLLTDNLFKIDAWPLYSDFKSTASLLRLAAVFTRQHTSIAQAAVFSQVSEIDVIAFLQACEATGLSINIDTKQLTLSSYSNQESKNLKTNVSNGLLFKLRSKLGLAFGR